MVQDFAKQRTRTPLAEPEPAPTTSSTALLLTGLLTGVAVGLFIALLVYLSGVLPPAPGQQAEVAQNRERNLETEQASTVDNGSGELTVELEREAQRLQLEFYQELPNYEVVVDATPINVPRRPATTAIQQEQPSTQDETSPADTTTSEPETAEPAPVATRETTPASTPMFLLQAGAFQQQGAANTQVGRLLGLGLEARVRQENLPGRTLFLVQAGPYNSRDEMMQAERVLRNANIESMRITLSQP